MKIGGHFCKTCFKEKGSALTGECSECLSERFKGLTMNPPTDERINRLLAEKIMKFRVVTAHSSIHHTDWYVPEDVDSVTFFKDRSLGIRVCDWNPILNIDQILECVDTLCKARSVAFTLSTGGSGWYDVKISDHYARLLAVKGGFNLRNRVIALALLEAVRAV